VVFIILAESNEDYGEIIAHTLKRDGHEVLRLLTAHDTLLKVKVKPADLVVLGDLEDFPALSVCMRIRELQPSMRIMQLSTAQRVADVIAALNAGADEFLGKPFDPSELLARSRALLRRPGSPRAAVMTPNRSSGAAGTHSRVTSSGQSRIRSSAEIPRI
jgi:DNA-binding response OmpR family regulator